jgi:hypothetical protein
MGAERTPTPVQDTLSRNGARLLFLRSVFSLLSGVKTRCDFALVSSDGSWILRTKRVTTERTKITEKKAETEKRLGLATGAFSVPGQYVSFS